MKTVKMFLAVIISLIGTNVQTFSMQLSEMSEAHANFAVELLRKSSPSDQSFVLSPLSIANAISMVYAGAKDQTEREMINVLGEGMYTLACRYPSFGTILESRNRLYVRSDINLKHDFMKFIDKYYNGQLKSVNFSSEAEDIAHDANQWLSERTRSRIRKIINPHSFAENAALFLINAIYFRGVWPRGGFQHVLTIDRKFYVAPDQEIMLPRMHAKKILPYYEDDKMQVLALPYAGFGMSLLIILPKELYGLADVEASLTGRKLLESSFSCKEHEVMISLPKFSLECNLSLRKLLMKLGMPSGFNASANFSSITDHQPLFIDNIEHAAVFKVTESGTDDTSATFAMDYDERIYSDIRVVADHAFLFAVIKCFKYERSKAHCVLVFNGRFSGTGLVHQSLIKESLC